MNPRCPFERLIVAATHDCRQAASVTRCEGAGIDCRDAACCARCEALQEFFEDIGAEAFDEVEDRTQVPHSTLLKIQIGGLAGVRQQLALEPPDASADLGALAQRAAGQLQAMDRGRLAEAMRQARARRRRH